MPKTIQSFYLSVLQFSLILVCFGKILEQLYLLQITDSNG